MRGMKHCVRIGLLGFCWATGCGTVSSQLAGSSAKDLALYSYIHQVDGEATASVSAELRTPSTDSFSHDDYFNLGQGNVLFDQGESFYLRVPDTANATPADLFLATPQNADAAVVPGKYQLLTVTAAEFGETYVVGYVDAKGQKAEYGVAAPASAIAVTAPIVGSVVSMAQGVTVKWQGGAAGGDQILLGFVPTYHTVDATTGDVAFATTDFFAGELWDGNTAGKIVADTGSHAFQFSTGFPDTKQAFEALDGVVIEQWNLYVIRRRTYLNAANSPFGQSYVTIDVITKVPVQLVD